MRKFAKWCVDKVKAVLGLEVSIFLGYIFVLFRPGAAPPLVPSGSAAPEAQPVPETWDSDDRSLFIEECRLDVAAQREDKRDIRARAQIVLTTAIVLGGAWVNSISGHEDLCGCGLFLYGLAGSAIAAAGLSAGGIITARSEVGTVSVPALTYYERGEIAQTVAAGYASTRLVGARTVATLVTVLRDSVLALVMGAVLLAVAHLVH